jgi:hypothetical protein
MLVAPWSGSLPWGKWAYEEVQINTVRGLYLNIKALATIPFLNLVVHVLASQNLTFELLSDYEFSTR